MILFHRSSNNYGEVPPWDEQVWWVFEITFSWKTFLLGFSVGDDVYCLNVGPLAFIYFYNWAAR